MSMAADSARSGRSRWLDHFGTLLRVALGGLMIWAGYVKLTAIEDSVRAVRAYEILPEALVRPFGVGVPLLEIIAGVLLVVGLFTRISAAIIGLLMVMFIVAIAQAWARGLSIDCGCFGGGGEIDPDETQYVTELIRDGLMLLAAAWLVWRPRTTASADRALFG